MDDTKFTKSARGALCTIVASRPFLLSSADEVACADIQNSLLAASFVPACLRIWSCLEPGTECREYQEDSSLAIKIAGDCIYMLGKDSKVRVFHMVLGRVVKEVSIFIFEMSDILWQFSDSAFIWQEGWSV